jgi:hypothetical protein
MSATWTLPEPYASNTPQDHADALRDHADPRFDAPMLDFVAVAAAEVIDQQATEIERLEAELAHARVDHAQVFDALEREKDRNPAGRRCAS